MRGARVYNHHHVMSLWRGPGQGAGVDCEGSDAVGIDWTRSWTFFCTSVAVCRCGHREVSDEQHDLMWSTRTFMRLSMCVLTLSIVASFALLSFSSASFSLMSSLRLRSSLENLRREFSCVA